MYTYLEASNNGGGKGRIVLRTKNGRIHKDEAHHTGK